jgi:DNA-binding transcriptional MocR family regulator
VYRERRDIMLEALQEFFPPEVTWTRPEGGLFLWVTLPEETDGEALFHAALRQNVAFVPGEAFYADDHHGCHLRLNFSNSKPEQIRDGISRLGAAVKQQLRTPVMAGG